jgi:hypothetical protein
VTMRTVSYLGPAERLGSGSEGPSPLVVGVTWFAVLFIPLAVIHVNVSVDGSAAYRTGRMLGLAAGSGGVAGLVALASPRLRSWWLSGLVAVGAACVGYAALELVPARADQLAAEERVGRAQPATGGDVLGSRLRVPGEVEGLRQLDGPAVDRARAAVEATVEKAPADLRGGFADVFYAEYRKSGTRVFYQGFNLAGGFQDEVSASPEQALVNFLAGFGIGDVEPVEPGPLGGVMACTDDEVPRLPAGYLYCVWVDPGTLGQVTVAGRDLDLADAAELTRAVRLGVTARR